MANSPSTRDPQKDKQLINEIGAFANAEDVGVIWEKEGLKKAQELASVLDDSLIVSKNWWTINTLTNLKEKLTAWKNRLEADENAILQWWTYSVLDKDIALIDERIVLLQDLWNPKEEFSIDETWKFAFVDKVFQQIGSYDFSYKMDEKSFYRWWDRIKVGDYNNNQGVNVTGPKWTLIVKIVWWEVVIEPMSLIDKRFSFTMTGNYTKIWTSHGLALTRRFSVDPTKLKPEESEEDLKNKLNDDQKERVEWFTDAEWLRIAKKYFDYGDTSVEEIKRIYDIPWDNSRNYAEVIFQFEQGWKIDQFEQKALELMRVFQEQMKALWWTQEMISKFGNHPTWIYWHLAKNEFIHQNREELSKNPAYKKYEEVVWPALENNVKNDQFLIDTMIGWELINRLTKEIKNGNTIFFETIAIKNINLWSKINQLIQKLANNWKISSLEYGELWKEYRESFNVADIVYNDDIPQFVKDILREHWISEEEWNLLSDDEKKIMEGVFQKNKTITNDAEKQRQMNEIMNGLREEIRKKKEWWSLGWNVWPINWTAVDDDTLDFEELPRSRFTDEDDRNDLEIHASIVDVQALYQERAEHEAEEQLRKEYEAMPRALFSPQTRKPWAVWNRFKTFWFRWEKKERLVRQYMEKYKREHKDTRNPEMIAAADRIEREFATGWDNDVESWLDWALWNHEDVDKLCRQFVFNNTMTEEEFERLFRDLVTRHPEIKAALGGNVDYVAWNIVLKLREKKSYFRMLSQFSQLAAWYTVNPDPIAYRTRAKAIAEQYIKETRQSLNSNIKNLLDIPVDQVDTERWLKDTMRKLVIASNTMTIKLDVLLHGKSAYAVDDTHAEEWLHKRNFLSKVWDIMDKWPKTSLVLWVWWWLATWIAVWWVVGWLVVPTLCALKIMSKKSAHYSKEHTGSEKKLVRGLDAEHQRLENLRIIMNDPNAGWFKKYRARRQYELYGETSHKDFVQDSRKVIIELETSLVSGENLDHRVSNALARLDYYHYSRHNFFGQQDDKQMEQVMNDLQALTLSGIEASRQWWETTEQARERLTGSLNYTNTYNEIDDALKQKIDDFKTKRRNLALKYGAACFAASLWLRLWFNKLFTDTWLDNATHVVSEEKITTQATQKLHQQIIDWFALDTDDVTKLESMFAWWQSTNSPEYFWDMLQEIKINKWGMSVAEFTDMKNNFMESYALEMQENGYVEILNNAEHVVRDPSDPIYGKVEAYLQSKWIREPGDGPNVLKHIEELSDPTNGTTYLKSMSQVEQRKTAEYLYMFLSKPQSVWINGLWWTYPTWWLLEASFEEKMMENTEWIERVVKKDPTFIDFIWRGASSVWMLSFANTYMEDIKHTPRNQTGEQPIITPRWFDIVTDTRRAPIEWSMAEWLNNNPL